VKAVYVLQVEGNLCGKVKGIFVAVTLVLLVPDDGGIQVTAHEGNIVVEGAPADVASPAQFLRGCCGPFAQGQQFVDAPETRQLVFIFGQSNFF
jgi:hypothetical protein